MKDQKQKAEIPNPHHVTETTRDPADGQLKETVTAAPAAIAPTAENKTTDDNGPHGS